MTPPESLTEEERRELEVYVSVTGPSSIRGVEDEVAKLLRIHDRLQGEVREMRESLELAEEMSRAHMQGQMLAQALIRELEALVENEASWRGGYEMTGEAGEQLFRLLGLEPRCLPPLD
jgi:DNA primase catalytic subunit